MKDVHRITPFKHTHVTKTQGTFINSPTSTSRGGTCVSSLLCSERVAYSSMALLATASSRAAATAETTEQEDAIEDAVPVDLEVAQKEWAGHSCAGPLVSRDTEGFTPPQKPKASGTPLPDLLFLLPRLAGT